MASKESVSRKSSEERSGRPAEDNAAAPSPKPPLQTQDKSVPASAEDVEIALEHALDQSRRRQAEMAALLKASRAILQYRDFEGAARAIFDSAKQLTRAAAGYVVLLTADGQENDVLFLDAGGLPCSVDPSLSMPIGGLRSQVHPTGKTGL